MWRRGGGGTYWTRNQHHGESPHQTLASVLHIQPTLLASKTNRMRGLSLVSPQLVKRIETRQNLSYGVMDWLGAIMFSTLKRHVGHCFFCKPSLWCTQTLLCSSSKGDDSQPDSSVSIRFLNVFIWCEIEADCSHWSRQIITRLDESLSRAVPPVPPQQRRDHCRNRVPLTATSRMTT